MAIAKVKKKEHENLTDKAIESVIEKLAQAKPITKTEACKILNISYNVTRLSKIIEEYKERKALNAKRRAANRGKPASDFETQMIIEGYLDGTPVSELSSRLFRSTSFVKTVVDSVGLPTRGKNYMDIPALPEQCVSERFAPGSIVWSCKYNAMAIITRELEPKSKQNSRDWYVYSIYVIEPIEEPMLFSRLEGYGGFHANQASYDLGSLEHLKPLGVDIYRPYRQYFTEWLAGK